MFNIHSMMNEYWDLMESCWAGGSEVGARRAHLPSPKVIWPRLVQSTGPQAWSARVSAMPLGSRDSVDGEACAR